MTGLLAAVFVGLAVCQVAIFLTTIYLHRTVSHKAITMRPGLAWTCRALLWLTTGIKARQWAAVHRRHHAFVDEEGDPHSPIIEGFWQVQLGNVLLYRKAAADRAAVDRYARDLVPDRWDRLFDHGLVGLACGIGLLFIPFHGDWRLVAVAAAVHVVSYLLLNSAVNAVGHTYGKRPYNGMAANSQWLAWLTAGEGLHSNHHAAPTSARLSFAGRELDPGWWCIAAGRRLHWLTVRHAAPKVAAKARRSPEAHVA